MNLVLAFLFAANTLVIPQMGIPKSYRLADHKPPSPPALIYLDYISPCLAVCFDSAGVQPPQLCERLDPVSLKPMQCAAVEQQELPLQMAPPQE